MPKRKVREDKPKKKLGKKQILLPPIAAGAGRKRDTERVCTLRPPGKHFEPAADPGVDPDRRPPCAAFHSILNLYSRHARQCARCSQGHLRELPAGFQSACSGIEC